MRKISLSEAIPHLLVGATVVTLLVVFLVNMFPPLKEAEIIDDSSYSNSESLSDSTKEANVGSSSDFSGNIGNSSQNSGDFGEKEGNTSSGSQNVTSEPQNGKININTASISELMTLDGIGEVKAKAIVEYREANGYFKSIDDLMLVKGVGEKTLEKNRDRITV